MAYNNRYRRYLDDDRYTDEKSSLAARAIGFGAVAIGVVAGGYSLYRSGALKGLLHGMTTMLGKYRGDVVSDAMRGLRNFAGKDASEEVLEREVFGARDDTRMNIIQEVKDIASNAVTLPNLPQVVGSEVKRGVNARANQGPLARGPVQYIRALQQANAVRSRLAYLEGDTLAEDTLKLTDSVMDKWKELTPEDAQKALQRTGFRPLTIGDMIDKDLIDEKNLFEDYSKRFEQRFGSIDKLKNKVADSHIVIDEDGNISDMRPLANTFKGFVKSLSEDFKIPFININPLQMFFTGSWAGKEQTTFALLETGWKQPWLTGDTKALTEPYLYANGKVHRVASKDQEFKFGEVIAEGMLVPGDVGPLFRYGRKMAGIETSYFGDLPDDASWFFKARHSVAKLLDFGFQDERREPAKLFDPTSWINGFFNTVWRKFPVHGGQGRIGNLKTAFGVSEGGVPAQYLFLNKAKTLGDVWDGNTTFNGFLEQFFAGRQNMQKVTAATMPIYMFMERLNAAFNAPGLAFSTANTGSAGAIFKNFMLRRAAPVLGAMAAWNYVNYEVEKMTGKEPEDVLVEGYEDVVTGIAKVRDNVGITKWAKHTGKLFPGSDQITEVPGMRLFDFAKSAEEVREGFESGESAIRKGRYWPMGNTPFTGGKVDHFEPVLTRQIKSDWQYTDTLYGSKDEYWKNAPVPTPRYPFAPIRHFVTDPYHYEKKHYKDRPYLLTGGIPELEEFPLIGPLLNATIGRILKPQRKMHPEAWSQVQGQTEAVNVPYADMPTIEGTESEDEDVRSESLFDAVAMMDSEREQRGRNLKMIRSAIAQAKVALDAGAVNPGSAPRVFGRTWGHIKEMGGFYGFAAESVLGEKSRVHAPVIADARAITSGRRQFWDMQIGGLGGDINEIGRRFVGKQERWNEAYNPIRNAMPTWMPGESYFIDFRHGDPYTKVAHGEVRLPGRAYEKLYGVKNPQEMWINASQVGGSPMEIIRNMLHLDPVLGDEMEEIVGYGNRQHRVHEARLMKAGVAYDVEQRVQDEEHKVSGIYDARVDNRAFLQYYAQNGVLNLQNMTEDEALAPSQAIMDFKTMSARKFGQDRMFEKNMEQINFYMHTTGIHRAYLVHLNRDDPKAAPKVYGFNYDPAMFKRTTKKLEHVRGFLRKGIDDGVISEFDMYDYVDRLRILADVAPWSDEYKLTNQTIAQMKLRPEDQAEVKRIHEQVKLRKKPMRLYEYQYQYSDIKKQEVTVKKVLDNNMFLVEEYDNPIRLAGIEVSDSKSSKIAEEARQVIRGVLRPGRKVTIGIDDSEETLISNDTYKTIRAVVYDDHVRNMNRELLRRGLAKEKENDYSAAAVHARFSEGEIRTGKLWERFAHMDTAAHTKFLQVRNPLESYERRDVYGKNWQTWEHPIRDFLVPTFQSYMENNPFLAVGAATWLGSQFGRTPFGKLVGALVGGGSMLLASTYRVSNEVVTGEKWIPGRRRKEREIEEYMDMLKYVKYRKLYLDYSEQAKEKEGVDIQAEILESKMKNQKRLGFKEYFGGLKRELKSEGDDAVRRMNAELLKKGFGQIRADDADQLMKNLNAAITQLGVPYKLEPKTPLAKKALAYHQAMESTMYAYDPGDSIQSALAGLPRKERQYIPYFLKAPAEERDRILQLVPKGVRRILQSAWGREVDEKTDIVEYFKTHNLPGEEWQGWNEQVDINNVKIKIVKHEAMDNSEFDIWPDDVLAAEQDDTPTPKMNIRDRAGAVRSRLIELFDGAGFEDVDVEIIPNNTGRIDIDLDIRKDRRKDVQDSMNENAGRLLG